MKCGKELSKRKAPLWTGSLVFLTPSLEPKGKYQPHESCLFFPIFTVDWSSCSGSLTLSKNTSFKKNGTDDVEWHQSRNYNRRHACLKSRQALMVDVGNIADTFCQISFGVKSLWWCIVCQITPVCCPEGHFLVQIYFFFCCFLNCWCQSLMVLIYFKSFKSLVWIQFVFLFFFFSYQ